MFGFETWHVVTGGVVLAALLVWLFSKRTRSETVTRHTGTPQEIAQSLEAGMTDEEERDERLSEILSRIETILAGEIDEQAKVRAVADILRGMTPEDRVRVHELSHEDTGEYDLAEAIERAEEVLSAEP